MVLERDILMLKKKSRHKTYTFHKNLQKMDHRSKYKIQNYKKQFKTKIHSPLDTVHIILNNDLFVYSVS